MWGDDLSGTMQDAGGVGGLLALTEPSNPLATNAQFVAYDGNGNVSALVDGGSGALTANYEYGPFGEGVRATGPLAKGDPFRFSTKYCDDQTDMIMYTARPYAPFIGHFLSRDPIEEDGGLNLYMFCGNDSVDNWDLLGDAWKVDREGKDRALVTGDCGDTVEQLAQLIHLNAGDYQKWLKAVTGQLPNSVTDPIPAGGGTFSIPNIGYVDASAYNIGGLGWRLQSYVHSLRSSWKSEGLEVVYTSTWSTTKSSILDHLASDNIYKFAYIGHGWSGQLTGLSDSGGTGDDRGIIAAGGYTQYGIARMELIACQSDNQSDLWKRNVSKLGTLRTAKGEVKLFNFDFVDEAGQ
jgi:RHS repeat-associated protein